LGKKTFVISLILLILSLIFFELTSTDFYLQDKLYSFEKKQWLFQDPQQLFHLFLYNLIKFPIYLIALWAIIKVIIGVKKKQPLNCYRPHLLIMLSLIIIPGSIATVGKKSVNVQCPYDIPRYGGTTPYVKLFEPYPRNPHRPDGKWPPGNCFPAGHASGGFALMSLYFLGKNKKQKIYAILFSMLFALPMSWYQTVKGSHYLSHHVVTFLLSLIIISTLNMAIKSENKNESSHH
jgi:membrane-associated PAP2 superfamily phosphatase